MKITMNTPDTDYVQSITEKFSLPILTSTVMSRRGIKEEDMKYYLEDDIVYQHSPFTVDDVYSAIERIEEALDTTDGKAQEKILIFGDRDVDGITSSAIMYKVLKKLGAENVSTRLPHGDEGYGLSDALVDEIIDGGWTLVITVDNGISAVDEIRRLEKNGVDVIVLDHHLASDMLPPAVAVFDPKVEGSGYPFSGLAGCAVAAKLGWALFFSRTPLYNSSVILLHASLGNGTVSVNAVRLENLVETGRCSDEFVIGDRGSLYSSPLLSFLSAGMPVIVLDRDTELTLLRKAFGNAVDISLEEFRPNLEKIIPQTKGKSLFDLSMRSRSALYSSGPREMETLVSLFRSASIYSFSQLTKDFEEIQSLEAIGTIADLMPITDENRLIVRKGLKLLSTRPPETLSYLLSKQGLIGHPITASNVSFKIAPVLNASGRMGEPETALSLLLASSYAEIETLTDKLLSLNSIRQKNEEEVLSAVSSLASSSLEKSGGKFIIVYDPSIPRGLTGSIASRLSSSNSVPALVLASSEDSVFGSLRCFEPWNAKDLLSSFSFFFEDYGGHRAAAGLRMKEENLESFTSAFYSYIAALDEEEKGESRIEVDAVLSDQDYAGDIWKTLSLFEPFGQENAELRFYCPDATLREAYHVGNSDRFMRLSIEAGGYIWPCVWWNADKNTPLHPGCRVSMVFSPEINWWKGTGREQFNISEIEVIK